ncbi:MAG: UvrD-helicase domain-containing protein [Treponema sp.]|nr:UvrD-helicase domain-containing protein [Treponema sp.]
MGVSRLLLVPAWSSSYTIFMRIIADLHIHSHFSRATSSKLTPPYLEHWARIKGIQLLGSGDCTHPAWLKELREQLDDAEEGLYTLKAGVRADFDAGAALSLPGPAGDPEHAITPRFVLTGEISTIYKQGDKTRKVHHLVILPDFKAAAAFQTALERRGNIRSDGRPILGISSRDLFALLLDTDERAILVPAHIWTPWFSALGAKSGFDSIDACYGDLAPHISAIETGLSSNPPMNWAVSSLDRFSIISNSDAHSPDKLGREGTVLEMDLSYPSLAAALAGQSGNASGGIMETIEFFPQEGQYHYDGHRKCGVYVTPEEADESGGLCPVCHKPLTRGVMGRVLELADRPVDEEAPCPPGYEPTNQRPYRSLIPLKELLGELFETGSGSKKVDAAYGDLIAKTGSELSLLMETPIPDLEKLRCPGLSGELLSAAVERMRQGQVFIRAGYDGEYGIIRVFPQGEKISSGKEAGFFDELSGDFPRSAGAEDPANPDTKAELRPGGKPEKRAAVIKKARLTEKEPTPETERPAERTGTLTLHPEQEKAVSYKGRYALIIAGPGTGKTATLAARIARLVQNGNDPGGIVALSFTVKAALELRERIAKTIGTERTDSPARIITATFHALCASMLREQEIHHVPKDFSILGDAERDVLLQELCERAHGRIRPQGLGKYIEARKRFLLLPGEVRPNLGSRNPGDHTSGETMIGALPHLAEDFGIGEADSAAEQLYGLYRDRLHASASLDFDDLVAETVRLLAGDFTLLSHYQERFRFVFVDEYQDINFAQYILIRLLASPDREEPHQELWVIGDPNQAIYGFRGSDKRFIDRFLKDYPEAGTFNLTQSFRCAVPILDAAGRLMDTHLAGTNTGVSLYRSEYPTEKSEAEGIARRISRLIGGTTFFAFDSNVVDSNAGDSSLPEQVLTGLDRCAILVRTIALAPPIVKAFRDHGIPYTLIGERPWWEAEPVHSLLGFLRDSLGRSAEEGRAPALAVKLAWEQYPQEPSKGVKARGNRDVSEVPPELLIERLAGIGALYDDLPAFLDALAVSGENSGMELNREGVHIMTIHASKGLEFDHVFVAGLEEGLLPFTRYEARNSPVYEERIAEERRLLYVAMTRAKVGLYLSWARQRDFQGRKLPNEPSRFLTSLETMIPLYQEHKSRPQDPQLRLF